MERIQLFFGYEVSFKVPDANRHENEVRNFMIVSNNSHFSLMYHNNDCSCKDGWIKFENIHKDTEFYLEDLSAYLKNYYGSEYDPTSLRVTADNYSIRDRWLIEFLPAELKTKLEDLLNKIHYVSVQNKEAGIEAEKELEELKQKIANSFLK